MMSQRQRRSPVPDYSPFRSSIPRTSDMPVDFDTSFSSQVSQAEMQHFSLSTSQPRQQYFQEFMPGDTDYFHGLDDSMSLSMSGPNMMNAPLSLSTPESLDDDSEVMMSLQGMNDSRPPPPYSGAELSGGAGFTSDYGFNYDSYSMEWLEQTPLSPPPEYMLKGHLDMPQELYGSSEEPTVCEHLGESKLQAYSKSNRSPHRPIRPSSERTQSQDSIEDVSSPQSRSDTGDKVKARSDPLYDMKPDKDGLYHCPKKSESNCTHKPTKQKCIFAKNLDSHLRPYTCRYASSKQDCEDLRFSSNACLFRHEREAHGMHNHGHNPYLCDYADCDRAKVGNGFPRRWNQRDHMKRVHGWGINSQPTADRRRRQGPSSVPMRRSGSGSRPRGPQPYSKDARPSVTSHHTPPQIMYAPVPDYTLPVTPALENFQYATSPHAMYYPSNPRGY